MTGMPDPRSVLQASLQVARYELIIAQEKVKTIEQLLMASMHPAPTAAAYERVAMAAAVAQQAQQQQAVQALQHEMRVQEQQHQAEQAPVAAAAAAAEAPKKRKRVLVDADGKIIKKAASGYNLYMTEMMKEGGKNGGKPNFGNIASAWKDLTKGEKDEWNEKAKNAAPKAVGEKWVDVDDEPKKKRKREKSGYNLYVREMMKDSDNNNNTTIQEVATYWKALTDGEKAMWNNKAKDAIDDEKKVDGAQKPAAKKTPKKAAVKEESDEEVAPKKAASTPKKKAPSAASKAKKKADAAKPTKRKSRRSAT